MAQYIPDNTKGYEPDLDNIVLALKGTTVLSGCAITAQGTPDMTVDVAVGVIRSGGAEFSVTNTDLTISASDPSNARIDLIVKDTTADGVPAVVAGTPSSPPNPPALPANRILLGYVSVAAAATNIQNSNISDRRLTAGDGAVAGTAASIPAATAVPAGTLYYDTTNARLQRSDGTNWTNVFGDATVTLAGLMTANDKKALAAQTDAETTGAITLDFVSGLTVEVDTTGNISITLSNGITGAWHAVIIHYGGTHTVTWTTTVKWAGDTEPTWTETITKTDIVALFYDGTNWYGDASLNFNV